MDSIRDREAYVDDLVIELSDPADPAPPSPPPPRKSLLGWAAVGLVAVALVAWLTPRPAVDGGPTDPDAAVPSEIAADGLPAGLSLGTLIIPTQPTRLVETGSHVGQRQLSGLHGQSNARSTVAELDGAQFLVVADTRRATSGLAGRSVAVALPELYVVTPATGTARSIARGFTSAVPSADGASALIAWDGGPWVTRLGLDPEQASEDFAAPPGRDLIGESVTGIVYATFTGVDHTMAGVEVVAADSGVVRYASGRPAVAVGRTSLALWRPGEGLVVVELHDRPPYATERPVPGVVEGSIGTAQFSRDGRYLAADVVDSPAEVHTVRVLDLSTGAWSQLPGTPVRATELRLLWNSRAGVLAVTTGARDTVLWRPGDPAAYRVPH